jgi:hypothetical protein
VFLRALYKNPDRRLIVWEERIDEQLKLETGALI